MENNTLQEQNFKEIVSNSLWKLFGMIFLGFLLGYLVYRDSEKDGNPEILYLIFLVILFAVIGIIMFLVKVIPAYKKIKKEKGSKRRSL